MHIHVKVFATLAGYVPGAKAGVPFDAEIVEGSNLAFLLRKLGLPDSEVKLTFVNGRFRTGDYVLKPGDDVGIFTPIGGG